MAPRPVAHPTEYCFRRGGSIKNRCPKRQMFQFANLSVGACMRLEMATNKDTSAATRTAVLKLSSAAWWIKPVFSVLPGLTLACLVGCASMLSRRVPELSFVSPVFLSVIVGMGISSVINLPVSFTPRLSFASRFLLLISIVLLDGGRADRGRHRCSLRMRGSDCINILVYAETCPFVSSKPRTNRSRP